jgi:REP element-mobilizing transposase RayT
MAIRQQGFQVHPRGGKRPGAGRKPKGVKAGHPHTKRRGFAAKMPVHVTVRVLPHVWNLRSRRSFRVVGGALARAATKFGSRLCEFSIQGNHLHLVVEAEHQASLSRAMKGVGVRIARGLNRLMGRKGKVLADRYHAHVLRTPTEVRHAVRYVRENFARHHGGRGVDEYSSANPEFVMPRPTGWLLLQVVRRE